MAAMATGTSSAFQGWLASRRTRPGRARPGRRRRDPRQVAGDLGLVPVDVVADQEEQGGDQAEDANGPADALAEAE